MLQSILSLCFFVILFVRHVHSDRRVSFGMEANAGSSYQLVMATKEQCDVFLCSRESTRNRFLCRGAETCCSVRMTGSGTQATPLLDGSRHSSTQSWVEALCQRHTRTHKDTGAVNTGEFMVFFLENWGGNCPYLGGNWETGILVVISFWLPTVQMFTK